MHAPQIFLPDVDIARLRVELVERDAKLRDFAQVNAQLRAQLVELQKNITFLTSELKRLLQGRRHLGAFDPNQGLPFPERETPADPALPQSLVADATARTDAALPQRKATPKDAKPAKATRRLDLSKYEREVRVRELPPEQRVCPKTGVDLQPIGSKVVEELEFVRSKLVVIEHRCTI